MDTKTQTQTQAQTIRTAVLQAERARQVRATRAAVAAMWAAVGR